MKTIIFCLILVLSLSKNVKAQSNAQNDAASSPAAVSAGTSAISAGDSAMTAAPSILGAATSANSSGKIGAAISAATGASYLVTAEGETATCAGCHGGCAHTCMMAAVHFAMGMADLAQAAEDMKSAGDAGNTAAATTGSGAGMGGGSGYTPTSGTDGTSPSGTAPTDPGYGISSVATPKGFISQMTNAGPSSPFSYDPSKGTVTTSSGQTISAASVGSAASMAQAGIPQSVISEIMASEKKIEAAAMKKYASILAADDGSIGGGGAGGAAAAADGANGGPGGLGARGPAAAKKDGAGGRDPNQLAGMQKDYNGQPIGVAGDSIFRMMSRRYQLKDSQSTFLTDAELLKK